MDTRTKRLNNELKLISKDPLPTGILSLGPTGDNNAIWEAIIKGPTATPYEKGTFKLQIIFGMDYPHKPPKVKFLTRVYHPNISANGEICLNLLKQDGWSPAYITSSVVLGIMSLLGDPNPNDPLVPSIALEFSQNRAKFEGKARLFVKKFAT